MIPALLIRLHPAGPWRFGPGEGGRDRVDTLYRSDRLYSALTLAFERLGQLERWLEATARAATPAVRLSSLFPFQGDTLFAAPPSTLWPPPAAAVRTSSPVFSTKVRWRVARFVPLPLIDTLLLGQRVLADQWIADAESGCLLRRDRPQSNPFRIVARTQIAVDRLGSGAESHSLACIEFEPAAGLWTAAVFETEEAGREWKEPLLAAFRLLADTGLGGRRASGWGQISSLKVQDGSWPGLLLPRLSRSKGNSSNGAGAPDTTQQHWLLSLFTPAADDRVDWSAGNYSLTVRGGRTESKAGHGAQKKLVRMVEEGSVLASRNAPRGSAVDVAPPGFAHAVYRAGFALTIPLPVVDFGAAGTESASTELEKALDEALKAAAEEGAIAAAEEKAESISERFSEAESSEPEENDTEFGQHLESIPNAAEPGDNTSSEIEETGAPGEEAVPDETAQRRGTTGQNAPQTAFEEAPEVAPDSEFPERLNVTETPEKKTDESEMKRPEITESGSGDEI